MMVFEIRRMVARYYPAVKAPQCSIGLIYDAKRQVEDLEQVVLTNIIRAGDICRVIVVIQHIGRRKRFDKRWRGFSFRRRIEDYHIGKFLLAGGKHVQQCPLLREPCLNVVEWKSEPQEATRTVAFSFFFEARFFCGSNIVKLLKRRERRRPELAGDGRK